MNIKQELPSSAATKAAITKLTEQWWKIAEDMNDETNSVTRLLHLTTEMTKVSQAIQVYTNIENTRRQQQEAQRKILTPTEADKKLIN